MVKRRFYNDNNKRYIDWIESAGISYSCARTLIEDKRERLYDPIAFHCHQCLEKSLKAFMMFKKHLLLDSHNLIWLCKKAMETDKEFEKWLEDCITLNPWYIDGRYPTDYKEELDYTSTLRLFKKTKRFYTFVCIKMNVRLIEASYMGDDGYR